ncbi:hypothetical protein [Microseira wollei]|uniref:Uncharacterized protein n=1 Tax=Microseira wollei NIES-4236 TaxID=2530354 RepID=A0AAV3XLP8_9CYAN|nr:hypothetical protein [Microseira wollei]GET42860.1 hypothetical protein MiSe_76780 [Microseira wollei NIES-4236]
MLSKSAAVIAGVISGLFLFLAFWLLGLPFPLSLCYGILGGVANSWIIAGWTSQDESKPAKEPLEPAEPAQKDGKPLSPRELFKLWQRERYERRPSAFFWKNARSNRLLRRLEREAAERKKKEQAGS